MTVLKQFGENGEEIGSEDVAINESNFQLYIDQYGKERAEGYKDAFVDIMKQITGLVTRNDEYGEGWGVSPQVAGTNVKKFHKQKSLTLAKIIQLLSDSKLKP